MSRLLRTFVSFTCLLLVSGLGLEMTAAPASAAVTYLCKGYSACLKAGMSASGYALPRNNRTMFWRMYSGHNCTNYAAYRMVHSGLPNARPWSGDGNAMNWGPANPRLTNSTPGVGAVAWYRANYGLAGRAGHVAYVEQVVSPNEIIISEDNWGGDFYWVRVTRSSGAWPSGFIHFNDVPLTNLAQPAVSGALKVGSTLSTTAGTWSVPGVAVKYQWRAGGKPIPGATGSTLALTPDLLGQTIDVQVTASRLGYPTTVAGSVPSGPVQPGTIVSTEPPAVSGAPEVPATLAATPGAWNVPVDAVAYQWTANGAPLPGATAPRLRLSPTLIGKTIAVTVTASKATYVATKASSAATAPVAPGRFTVSRAGQGILPAPGGRIELGQTVSVTPPVVRPAGTVSVQWYRGRTPIAGATGRSYTAGVADLGSRLSALVSVTRTGFTPLQVRLAGTWRVRSTPRIKLTAATRGRGKLRVSVLVTAPGVTPVTGTVLVRAGRTVLGDLTLRGGHATRLWLGRPAGTVRVYVRYRSGMSTFAAGASTVAHVR